MGRIIDISFNGVTNSLPDDSCTPGDVSMAFGLTSGNYVSTSLQPKQTHLHGIDGCDIVLVHKGYDYENVFIHDPATDETRVYRLADLANESSGKECLGSAAGKPSSTAVIGNMVILCFNDKTLYAYRKGDSYDFMDNNIPPLSMEIVAACRTAAPPRDDSGIFVDGACKAPDGLYPITLGGWLTTGFSTDTLVKQGDTQDRLNENDMEKSIMSQFNAIIGQWGKHGYLFSPVIVRAAYRLKSGGLAGVTNPVLCFPFDKPMMAAAEIEDDGWIFRAVGYKLYAKFTSEALGTSWEDIIDSVEVYMSAPIYTHSTDGTDIRWYDSSSTTFNGFGDFFNKTPRKVIVPGKTDNMSYKKLEEVSTFYKVLSLPFTEDELKKDFLKISNTEQREAYLNELYEDSNLDFSSFANGYRKLLTNIDGRDMDVTSDALATLSPLEADPLRGNISNTPFKVAAYNARLINIGNSYDLDKLPSPSFFSQCVSLYSLSSTPSPSSWSPFLLINAIAVSYDQATRTECIFSPHFASYAGGEHSKYLTLEEPNVKKVMALTNIDGVPQVATLVFKRHDFLNMSIFTGSISYAPYYLDGNEDTPTPQLQEFMRLVEAMSSGTANHKVSRYDYIRESNVADPYTFEDGNSAYFNSRVTDLLVVPESVSLGQYGTDQMYAICEDGIYTVSIDAEGKLQRVNTYANGSIKDSWSGCIAKTQLFFNDGQDWGYYSGQKENVFLPLSRNLAFHYDNIPLLTRLNAMLPWLDMVEGDKIFDFLTSCKLHYDAANGMIVGTCAGSPCVAVWHNRYGLHLLPCKAAYAVPSGKLLLADDQQNLYDFSESSLQEEADGIIVTRPLRFGETPLSTIRSVVARGKFNKKNVGMVLYGTRDYANWHYVASSRTYYLTNISGTPYKAYKVVLVAKLGRDEYVSRLTFYYVEKMSGRTIL